jgi:hypothetical protein
LLKPLQPYPALLVKKGSEKALVVADLHIGWEVALAEEGIHVPSQTPKLLNKMLRIIELCKPTSLVFLGDVKHAIAKVEIEEWRDIPAFFEVLSKKVPQIQVVLGNHDGNLESLLPKTFKIFPSTGFTIGDVGLFHGNSWPAPELLQCRNLVMGHIHPTVAFRDPLGFRITTQVWVKAKLLKEILAKAFLKSQSVKTPIGKNAITLLRRRLNIRLKASELFIMPYFNDFLGGRPINRQVEEKRAKTIEYLGPLLRSGSVYFDYAEVYLLDGTFLGTVNQLRSLS